MDYKTLSKKYLDQLKQLRQQHETVQQEKEELENALADTEASQGSPSLSQTPQQADAVQEASRLRGELKTKQERIDLLERLLATREGEVAELEGKVSAL